LNGSFSDVWDDLEGPLWSGQRTVLKIEKDGSVMNPEYELVIVGGGPAGLSSALIAGRARRKALLVDGGVPRNAAAPAMHGFISRDGILPRDFRRIAHEELPKYSTIERSDDIVDEISGVSGSFEIALKSGRRISARRVILTLGIVDSYPAIESIHDCWGRVRFRALATSSGGRY
jgi:thioredoxin reductase